MTTANMPNATNSLLVDVIERKAILHRSQSKWKWALLNLMGAASLAMDAGSHSSKSILRTSISKLEMFCVVLLLINAIYNMTKYFFPFLRLSTLHKFIRSGGKETGDVILTAQQMQAFKIKKGDMGFKMSTIKTDNTVKPKHPFGFPSPLIGSISESPPLNRSKRFSNQCDRDGSSNRLEVTFEVNRQNFTLNSSWRLNNSLNEQSHTTSPSLKRNSRIISKFNSSVGNNGAITDQSDLQIFLKEYKDWEKSVEIDKTVASSPRKPATPNLNSSYILNRSNFSLAHGAQIHNNTSIASNSSSHPLMFSSTARGDMFANQSLNESKNVTPEASRSLLGASLFSSLSPPQRNSFMFEETSSTNTFYSAKTKKRQENSSYDVEKSPSTELICDHLGMDRFQIMKSLEKLSIWISETILQRIVNEIKETNKLLVKNGMGDEQIGKTSIRDLRKVANLPQLLEKIPSLYKLVSFLEISYYQEYLVNRLSELAAGGGLSNYKWNSGGKFRGMEWSDKLPTDAEIVMNCVSSYLDQQIPSHYHYNGNIDSKPFTGVYFLKNTKSGIHKNISANSTGSPSGLSKEKLSDFTKLMALTGSPNSPTNKKSDANETKTNGYYKSFAIVQNSVKPPHFVVQQRSNSTCTSPKPNGQQSLDNAETTQSLEVGAGRNNLFYALLLFLHLIETKENGKLDRIDLGSSGINVLWVLED